MRYFYVAMLSMILVGCQPKKSASLHIDPTLESLVPADTVFVAGANADAVRAAPVYQKLIAKLPVPQIDEFTRRTGLDPRKDVSQILSCWDGKHGLVMARGKFQKADLEARLQATSSTQLEYKNQRLFGSEQGAIVVLNDSTVIAGPAAELRSIIDRGQTGHGLPPALADLLRTLPPDDQVYAALIGGLESLSNYIPPGENVTNFMQAFRSVDSAVAGINLSSGVNLIARIHSNTDRDAKFVHDMLRGLVGFGRLNTPENRPELLKLYDAIQVTQRQTETLVQADIPSDQAEQFLNLFFKR